MTGVDAIRDAAAEEIADVRRLFTEYQAEIGVDLCFQGFAEELATLPGRYAPPVGRLLVSITDSELSGCGGLRALGPRDCEMKRLYVRPSAQGSGTGRAALLFNAGSDGSAVRSLVVNLSAGPGIHLVSGHNVVEDCYLGTDKLGGGMVSGNFIGLSTSGDSNTIG